jgi:MYXO-CTERM domain-containing protein
VTLDRSDRADLVYRERVPTCFDSRWVLGIAALGATLGASATARAHFVLTSPAAAYEQSALGDPQKAPPCGDDGSAVATGMVTAFQAGETITITIDETIYHPGHYRIAIAENDPSELPEEPPVTPGSTPCGSAPIMEPPVYPVLADGVFLHDAPFGEPQSIDITLPDISCTNCTLQVIQFMTQHGLNDPGGCFYHHCATISIEGGAADASTTMPGEDSGSTDGGSVTNATTVTAGDDSSSDGGPGPGDTTNPADDGSVTDPTGATLSGGSDTDTETAGTDDEDDGGCSCSTDASDPLATFFGVVVVLGLRRRRR